MKRTVLIIAFFLFLTAFNAVGKTITTYRYGLSFNSYASSGSVRTSLILDDGKKLKAMHTFKVSFDMLVRDNIKEPDFGSVLHVTTNKGQTIRLFFSAEGVVHMPAVITSEGMNVMKAPIVKNKWCHISLLLNFDDSNVTINYNGKIFNFSVPLKGTESVGTVFGRCPPITDVAPVDIRDIKIMTDGNDVRHWKLEKHDGDVCYDELSGVVAKAQSPHWLIDDHRIWQKVYEQRLNGYFDVAFDDIKGRFFIIRDGNVSIENTNLNVLNRVSVISGYPAIKFAEHAFYDKTSDELVTYSLSKNLVSRFSFKTGRWSQTHENKEEAVFYNHARAYDNKNRIHYFFGGYGFYKFRNELFCMKDGVDKIEKINYQKISPRFSSAIAVVDGYLYVFGGKGNKYGKQEIDAKSYCEMSRIDLKTGKSKILWSKRAIPSLDFIMASTMYYVPSEKSFYAATLQNGGILLKIHRDSPEISSVSGSMHNTAQYQDGDFSLYHSPTLQKFFMVMNKKQNDGSHLLYIYSLNTPIATINDMVQVPHNGKSTMMIMLSLVLMVLLTFYVLYLLKRRKRKSKMVSYVVDDEEKETVNNNYLDAEEMEDGKEVAVLERQFFNVNQSAILLLGNFSVKSRDGEDITTLFTPKLRSLLEILILYSEKDGEGILVKKLTDVLWYDKDEISARNNRNVSLRKLRILLEKVGEVTIVNENEYLRISIGSDVMCDYCQAWTLIHQYEDGDENENGELFSRIMELLLRGPLLANMEADWVDDFKSNYSSKCLDLLSRMLKLCLKHGNYSMVLRISDIMFLHDTLNEEALAASCAVLSMQGKKGLAKNVYDHFCNNYNEMMGEKFDKPFSDYGKI